MPLPRPRFTVRWLMVAAFVVAALLGAFEAGRRWERELGRDPFAGKPYQNVPAFLQELPVHRVDSLAPEAAERPGS